MRAALLLALSLSASAGAAPKPASPLDGPALAQALVKGEVDPAGYDFGALRHGPGQTMAFLAANATAQTAVAKAHGQPSYAAVIAAHICPTPAERLSVAGFESALIAPSAADWAAEKTAAEAAYVRYQTARDAVLAGGASPYPEFESDAALLPKAKAAPTPEAQALFARQIRDRLWRHAVVLGAPKGYAEGLGRPGAIWLNARLNNEGCAVGADNARWLATTLKTVPWFNIKTYGKEADAAAWTIAQHADADPALQTLVLDRIGQLALKKDSNPANFAYLWDRVALNAGRPQRYGTQMHCIGTVWAPITPLEDAKTLDQRRAWVSLPREADAARAGGGVCGG